MKMIIVATVVAASALAGAAQAGASATNYEFLQAARCRGLATSEGLGKVDTASIDAFLRDQGASREGPVRVSARNKIADAQKEGDKAEGAKKDKLLAERSGACSAWLNGASTGAAVNTAN
jgi:hypothetical protein